MNNFQGLIIYFCMMFNFHSKPLRKALKYFVHLFYSMVSLPYRDTCKAFCFLYEIDSRLYCLLVSNSVLLSVVNYVSRRKNKIRTSSFLYCYCN